MVAVAKNNVKKNVKSQVFIYNKKHIFISVLQCIKRIHSMTHYDNVCEHLMPFFKISYSYNNESCSTVKVWLRLRNSNTVKVRGNSFICQATSHPLLA